MPSHQQAPEHLSKALAGHEDHIGSAPPTTNISGTTSRRSTPPSNAVTSPKRSSTTTASYVNDSTTSNTSNTNPKPFTLPFRSRTTSLTIIEPITFPSRASARSSPIVSRAPSFAISEQQPRPWTGSSTTTGHVSLNNDDEGLTPQTSPEEGADTDTTTTPLWTPALADRLTFVQRQKWESQKRWSAGQEAWEKEEEHLLDTRKVHLKAVKRASAEQVRAEKSVQKAVAVWKRKTFFGKRGNVVSGGEDGDDDIDGNGAVRRISSGSLDGYGDAAESVVEFAAKEERAKHPVLQSPLRRRTGLKGLMRRMSGAKGPADD